jgi:hypothetical protein
MPTNLLILPLLAGFWLVHHSHRYRFRAQHLDGYRLLLHSALAGSVLLLISRILIVIVNLTPLGAPLKGIMLSLAPIDYLGTSLLCLLLGWIAPKLQNNKIPRRYWKLLLIARFDRSIISRHMCRWRRLFAVVDARNARAARDNEVQKEAMALAQLLDKAQSTKSLISITLSNRKWYVGYVAEALNLKPQETYFRLLPIISGYRDKDTLQTRRRIYYPDTYADPQVSSQDFVIVIPLKDIQIANLFDEAVYEDHFAGGDVTLVRQSTQISLDARHKAATFEFGEFRS